MSDGVLQNFLSKLEQFWLFHIRDFCICVFDLSFLFEVGGTKVDVTYINQSEFSNI